MNEKRGINERMNGVIFVVPALRNEKNRVMLTGSDKGPWVDNWNLQFCCCGCCMSFMHFVVLWVDG